MMKWLKAFSFLFVFFVLTWSCDDIVEGDPVEQDYFMKFYGSYFNDNLSDIAVTNQEEILMAGHRKYHDDIERGWLIKTRADGMEAWEREFVATTHVRLHGLMVDEHIHCVGCRDTQTPSKKEGFLCAFNDEGELLDSLVFDVEAEVVKDMKFLTQNTHLRIVVHAHNADCDEVCIYELGDNDHVELVSRNSLYNVIDGRLYFYEQEDGRLYLSGSMTEPGSDGKQDIMVARLVDDNILWSYTYGETGVSECASGIVLQDDDLYVTATRYASGVVMKPDVFMMRINTSGIEQEIMEVALSGNNASYSMIHHYNQQFVLVGKRIIDNKNSKVFMSIVDDKGHVVMEQVYGNKGLSQGKFVKNRPGSKTGFVISGDVATSAISADAVDVLVIKASQSGEWID